MNGLEVLAAIDALPPDERARTLRFALDKYPPPELVVMKAIVAKAQAAAAQAKAGAAPALPASSELAPPTATGAAQ